MIIHSIGVLTWYLEVEVTDTTDSGDGSSLLSPGDALSDTALTCHLHRERAACGDEHTQQGQGSLSLHFRRNESNEHYTILKIKITDNSQLQALLQHQRGILDTKDVTSTQGSLRRKLSQIQKAVVENRFLEVPGWRPGSNLVELYLTLIPPSC